jgi:hypothetical protein
MASPRQRALEGPRFVRPAALTYALLHTRRLQQPRRTQRGGDEGSGRSTVGGDVAWGTRYSKPQPADFLLSRIVDLAVTLTRWGMNVDSLLLSSTEIQRALGPDVVLSNSSKPAQVQALGDVLGATAIETAFRSVSGLLHSESGDIALAVATLALVFDTEGRASATFNSVGQVAHLRTKVGASMVAVETVTAPSGLVSYWGYVHHAQVMVIVTLDTLDPQRISMTEFRAVVSLTADRLERQVGSP